LTHLYDIILNKSIICYYKGMLDNLSRLRHSLFIIIISAPAAIAVCGALVYFAYGLNRNGAIVAALISLLLILFIFKYNSPSGENELRALKNISLQEWLLFLAYFALWLIALWFLYTGRSDRPIITPWQVVSSWYFLTYALGTAALFLLGLRSSRLLAPGLILHCLLLFGTAVVVYVVGYGFDPFIHEAAVQAIDKLGQIKPLTPYYLGQYSLVTVGHLLSGFDTSLIGKILVPTYAALLLPLLIFRWLKTHHGAEKDWGLAAVALLILPSVIFIVTTPQNLAYLFLAIVLFLPSPKPSRQEKIISALAALAALVTQPIAGIPAAAIVIGDYLRRNEFGKKLYPFLIALLSIAIPLSLYVFLILGSGQAALIWPRLDFLKELLPSNPNQESWWLNFIYFYRGLWGFVLLGTVICGIYLAFKRKNAELVGRFTWPALALFISALITASLDFHFLIEYERSDYPLRIIITALLVSLPLIVIAFKALAVKLEKLSRWQTLCWLLIIVSAATASLYLSYPRFDHYHNSHSYATSKADILAVRWIEQNANGQPYIVLANQQVSAAALREYGFKTYYKDSIFYYPIPTGTPMYQYYLDMVDKPDRAAIIAAMDLAGVKRAYLVLNSYWWQYNKLVAQTTSLADTVTDIGDGQITVFLFTKK